MTSTATDLAGKTVLVTGAAAGIGRETAIAIANTGAATVILVDRSAQELDETAQLVEQGKNARAIALAADVSDPDAIAALFDRALSLCNTLDCAFNNAGVVQMEALTADIEFAEWERILRINLTGVWLCMRAELKHMVQRGKGSIVNTASVSGLRSHTGRSAYVASKNAVIGLTKNAAVEYAQLGIRINAVAPGGVHTALVDKVLAGLPEEHRAPALASFAGLHPMNRMGKPSEIADAVIYLLSDRASFVTGHVLGVDGGWAAT